jgi:hypothetical protein
LGGSPRIQICDQPLQNQGLLESSIESPEIKPGDAVLVDFTVYQTNDKDKRDGPLCQKATSWLVVVGQNEINDALDIALTHMQNHQLAFVWSTSKYAFGPHPRTFSSGNDKYTLPPDSRVLYHITRAMKVKDTARLNPYFTLQKTNTRKMIANDLYLCEWPQRKDRALRLYETSAKDMEALVDGTYFQQVGTDHPQYKEARQLMIDSYNNILALHMRAKQYALAKEAGAVLLKKDPRNLKALLRLAKVAMMDPKTSLEEADSAIQSLENAVTYKNKDEEEEARKLRATWKKKKAMASN